MKLWLDGRATLEDPPEELFERAQAALTVRHIGPALELPIYESGGLSVRFRFVEELPQAFEPGLHLPPVLPSRPAVSTLVWFWVHVLEGLLWSDAGQVAEVTARREWGRVAGLEVTV